MKLFNKLFKKKNKLSSNNDNRYFVVKCEDAKYEASCTLRGGDTLLGILDEFRKKFGYGIEFTVTEITKKEFDNIKEDSEK